MASEKGHFSYSSKDQKRMLVTLFISVLLCPHFWTLYRPRTLRFFPSSWSKSQYLLAFLPSVSSTSLKQQWEWSIIAGLSLSLSPTLFPFEHPAEKLTSRGKQLVNGLQSLEKQGHLTIGQSRNGLLRIYLSTLTFEQRSHDFFRSSKHLVPFPFWPCKNILTHSLQRWPMKMAKELEPSTLWSTKAFFL